MKKVLLFATLILFCSINSFAYISNKYVYYDGIVYVVGSGFEASCVGYDKDWFDGDWHILKELNIPETIEYNWSDYKVVSVRGFENCKDLKRVTIPPTVKSIGSFKGCSSLEYVKLPSSIEKIEEETFMDCPLLELDNGSLPYDLKYIGDKAFYGCKNMTKLELPYSLQSIGAWAFYDCQSLTELVIPDKTTIGEHAFDGCFKLEKLKIGNGIKNIPAYAFNKCRSLKELILPKELQYIREYAFSGCYSLEELFFGNGQASYLKEIGHHAFAGCRSLKKLYFDVNFYIIGYCSFESCNSLTELQFANRAYEGIPSTQIQDQAFLCGSSQLSSIIIPDYITYIGHEAFLGHTNVKTIQFNNSYYKLGLESESLNKGSSFLGIKPTTLILNRAIINDNKAGVDCSNLQNLYLGGSLQNVSNNMFKDCKTLKYVSIDNEIKCIGDSAFSGCTSLEKIDMPLYGLKEIGNMAFYNCCSLAEIQIPRSVKTIGNESFAKGILKKITIPPFVASIGNGAFSENKIDDLVFEYDYLMQEQRTIGDNAFANNMIVKVTIPKRVKNIGNGAFRDNCIQDLHIESYGPTIGDYAFLNNDFGDNILTLPYCTIGQEAFAYSNRLNRVVFESSINKIPSRCFYGCPELERVEIYDVKEINESAFADCPKLSTVTIEQNSLKSIGINAFSGCNIREIDDTFFKDGLNIIGEGAFSNNPELTSIKLPASISSIGSNAFANDNKIMAIDCVTLDVPQLAESAFTSNVYDNCKVNVLGDMIPQFRAATGWRNFKWFLDAGVDDIIADEDAGEPIYFNLRGEPIATPEIPGIYIELRNGKSRKIYVQ